MSAAASVRASRSRVSARVEKRFVVGLERFGAERLERVAQLRFGLLVRLQPLGVDRALFVELGPNARCAGRTPATADRTDEHAKGEARPA